MIFNMAGPAAGVEVVEFSLGSKASEVTVAFSRAHDNFALLTSMGTSRYSTTGVHWMASIGGAVMGEGITSTTTAPYPVTSLEASWDGGTLTVGAAKLNSSTARDLIPGNWVAVAWDG